MGKWTSKTGKDDKAKAGEEPVVLFGGDVNKMATAIEEMDARTKATAPKTVAEQPVVIDVDKVAKGLGDKPAGSWAEKAERKDTGPTGPGGGGPG